MRGEDDVRKGFKRSLQLLILRLVSGLGKHDVDGDGRGLES